VRQFALIPVRYSEVLASGAPICAVDNPFPFLLPRIDVSAWRMASILILNMWTLWLFGPTIEDRLG